MIFRVWLPSKTSHHTSKLLLNSNRDDIFRERTLKLVLRAHLFSFWDHFIYDTPPYAICLLANVSKFAETIDDHT